MIALTPVLTPPLLKSFVVSAVLLVLLAVAACLIAMSEDWAQPEAETYVGSHRMAELPYRLPSVLLDRVPLCPPMHYLPLRVQVEEIGRPLLCGPAPDWARGVVDRVAA